MCPNCKKNNMGIVKDKKKCDCKVQKMIPASKVQRREKVGKPVRLYEFDQFLSCGVRTIRNM